MNKTKNALEAVRFIETFNKFLKEMEEVAIPAIIKSVKENAQRTEKVRHIILF